ncbi:hypothetical protein EB796_015293 [Bugula neritina]|uniref:Uncharacterized protein n=1 Tax=Bugula neritina TaxID=10212 RepID=A0A7J7JJV9_BUGNE|nr:hypothetical protein EB796_015293 [Bugula neritina]
MFYCDFYWCLFYHMSFRFAYFYIIPYFHSTVFTFLSTSGAHSLLSLNQLSDFYSADGVLFCRDLMFVYFWCSSSMVYI